MNELLTIWAKYKDGIIHPLICHLYDVAAVTQTIWREALAPQAKQCYSNSLGLKESDAEVWIAFWAGLHDLGKASPSFQNRCSSSKTRTPHGTITAYVLPKILRELFPSLPQSLARQVAITIGGHHGELIKSQQLMPHNFPGSVIGKNSWESLRRELAKILAQFVGIDSSSAPSVSKCNHCSLMLLAGLVSVADWIASSEDFFEFTPQVESLNEYAEKVKKNADRALKQMAWKHWEPKKETIRFADFFAFAPRPLQDEVIELAPRMIGPGLVLIEAPMGEGKTEAAFYLADHWNTTLGQQGTYIALPTQATANAMFTRFRNDYLAKRYITDTINFHLLHGQAMLSDEFETLRVSSIYDEEEGEKSDNPNLLAQEWFTYRKRGLLSPFGVGTIDQSLMAVLQTKHVFVRLFGLAYKTVIIDEVHAYDTYMSTLLDRLLEWLAALNTSVVLLSATLTRKRREELIARYSGVEERVTPEKPYPRISWVVNNHVGSLTFSCTTKPEQGSNKIISLSWIPPDKLQLVETIRDSISDGGCVAIVCNTVANAQDTYSALKDALRDVYLYLFHARFPFYERDRREKQVIRLFGKHSSDRPKRAVLVATQVIEQSLDLDFDLMVSELAPMDLILQRAGRLHRHERSRPQKLRQPSLLLVRPAINEEAEPDLGPSRFVYGEFILIKTYLTLRYLKSIQIPDDVEQLVEAAYSEEAIQEIPEVWKSKLSMARKHWDERIERLEMLARKNAIKKPRFSGKTAEISTLGLKEDQPEIHVQLQALTRWSERPSISVICLFEKDGRHYLDRKCQQPIDLDQEVSPESARKLIELSMILTGWQSYKYFREQEPPLPWRHNALLRHHRLALFDTEGRLISQEYALKQDPELGAILPHEGKE